MRKYLLLLLIPILSYAETCQKLSDCLSLGEKLLHVKFIYAENLFPPQTRLNQPVEMDKENADQVLSEVLSLTGFAKVPSKVKGNWKLINARDIRYDADLPTFDASKKITPDLPDNQDPVRIIYQGIKGADMNKIIEDIRPLLSRFGRAQPLREGVMVINDRASHLTKLLPVLQSQDMPLTREEKEARSLKLKREFDLEMARQKSSHRHDTDFPLNDEHDH